MAAYGLYTHIRANKRRSIALLIGLFLLVYLLVYAGALLGEALTSAESTDVLLRRALADALAAAPFATAGTVLWIAIAYKFHQSMIDAVTGGREVTRQQAPGLYNLLENLCISRGISMPRLRLIENESLNAFATGMNERQYSITVTSGLVHKLDNAEIESVLGHELTHIRNGDVRLLVIAVIIAGVISFFAELVYRLLVRGGIRWGGRGDGDRRGAGIALLIAAALIAVAWLLSVVIRFALSRKREFLADAGSVELTKNPDAMISALRKIEGRGELPDATSAVMEMCIDNPREGFSNIFDTHPPGRGADRNERPEAASRFCRAGRRWSSAPRRQQTASPARGDRTGNSRRFSAVSARSESHFGPRGQSLSGRMKRDRPSECAPSLRLDACELDHLGPFVDIFADELGELVRGVRGHRYRAEIGEPLLDVRIEHRRVGLLVERRDDLGRCAHGNAETDPAGRFVALEEAVDRRHVRQEWKRFGRRHAQGAELSGLDLRQ